MTKLFKSAALALAASSVILTAVPAEARHYSRAGYSQYDRYGYGGYSNGYSNNGYSAEPVSSNSSVWQGRDGSYYCQKKDGTTGLIIGAAAGALLGRAVDRGGDRTLGTVIGAAAGALLGKRVAQGTSCR
ncbi:MAG: glycine zipper 2TM domain-containing protein [Croceibacterium sp.]